MNTFIYLCVLTILFKGNSAKLPLVNVSIPEKAIPKEIVRHSAPYVVGLFLTEDAFCTGVLVTPKHVLTSAICVNSGDLITVVLGAHNILLNESTQVSINATNMWPHPDFTYDNSGAYNDIGVIELPHNVTINNNMKPIQLAGEFSGSFKGRNATVVDWLLTLFGHPTHIDLHTYLKKVELPVISNEKCSEKYNLKIHKEMVCTGAIDGIDSCPHHPGAPLVYDNQLIGIVSYANYLCNISRPTIYTRISKFRNWLSVNFDIPE